MVEHHAMPGGGWGIAAMPDLHHVWRVTGQPIFLDVRAPGKSVPGPRQLFRSLDLQVNAGELVAIIGESGVRKSTLLNILAGLDDADEGSVVIAGTVLGTLDEASRTRLRRERIGFVFQAFHILPYLTLSQNVALPLALVSRDAAGANTRATEMLDAVGLGDRGEAYRQPICVGREMPIPFRTNLVSCDKESVASREAKRFAPTVALRPGN